MPVEDIHKDIGHLFNRERVKSDETSAQLYTRRKPRKHRSEMQLVAHAIAALPKGEVRTVLDAPCGVGRISAWLARQGYQISGIDLGAAAVRLSRELFDDHGLTGDLSVQNIMAMNFSDQQFDASICFRLLHHFRDPDDKEALIRELCRVTSGYVIISYFSPRSLTTLKRRIRKFIFNRPLKQYPDRLSDLNCLFKKNGFRLYHSARRSQVLHSLQLAVFKRIDEETGSQAAEY